MKIIKKVKNWLSKRKTKTKKITGNIARFVSRGVKSLFTRRRSDDGFYKETHKESLEISQAKNFTNAKHREKRAEEDPIIYALVTRVANSITVRTPIFLDKEGNEMDDLKELWEKLRYNSLLNDVIQSTRTHGFMVLESLVEGEIIDRSWLVHDSTDIQLVKYKKFNIVGYTVLPLVESGQKTSIIEVVSQYDLVPEEVIHFYIGKFKLNGEGVAAIRPVWDNAVRYSEILGAMARYDSRIGNGMMTVVVDRDDYTGEVAKLKTAVSRTNTKNFLILKSTKAANPPEIKWESATNRINWEKDLGEIMKVICGATGLNVRWFIGDPKGAQSAAKEDKVANYQTFDSIFMEYVPFIRKLLITQDDGEALNESVAEIKWDSEGVLDEDDVEEIDESDEDGDKDELQKVSKDKST